MIRVGPFSTPIPSMTMVGSLNESTIEKDRWLEEVLQKIVAMQAAKTLRRDNLYVRYIIRVLWAYKKGLRRTDVIYRVWGLRNSTALPIPKKFDATVQSALNNHNEASSEFQRRSGKLEDALLYPFGGKGSGIWAIHHDRAEAWLRRKALGQP
jgi:hypothetical protein